MNRFVSIDVLNVHQTQQAIFDGNETNDIDVSNSGVGKSMWKCRLYAMPNANLNLQCLGDRCCRRCNYNGSMKWPRTELTLTMRLCNLRIDINRRCSRIPNENKCYRRLDCSRPFQFDSISIGQECRINQTHPWAFVPSPLSPQMR